MDETNSRMHRGHGGKLIGGVCGALAAQFKLDVVVVRVLFMVGAMLSAGMAIGVYLLFWALTPAAPGAEAPANRWVEAAQRFGSASPSGHPVPDADEPKAGG